MWSATSAIVAAGAGWPPSTCRAGLHARHRPGAAFRRSCSAVCSLFQALTFGDTKPGTNVTMMTPPFFGSICRMLSGTLRGVIVQRPRDRVREDDRRLRRRGSRRPSCRATRGSDRPASRASSSRVTTSSPKADSPLLFGVSVHGVGPRRVARVRERHVARAEPMEHPQVRERVVDRVAALHADERRDLARPCGSARRRPPVSASSNVSGILPDHAMDDVDLLERGGDRGLSLHRRRARRRTRTARRRRRS